jgi:hypothetical protein
VKHLVLLLAVAACGGSKAAPETANRGAAEAAPACSSEGKGRDYGGDAACYGNCVGDPETFQASGPDDCAKQCDLDKQTAYGCFVTCNMDSGAEDAAATCATQCKYEACPGTEAGDAPGSMSTEAAP